MSASRRHYTRWDEIEVNKLRTLVNQGLNDISIARQFGRSAQAIKRARERFGITRVTKGPNEEDNT